MLGSVQSTMYFCYVTISHIHTDGVETCRLLNTRTRYIQGDMDPKLTPWESGSNVGGNCFTHMPAALLH